MALMVQAGSVYSITRGQGRFGVVKVIAHQAERDTIYVRIFTTNFKVRPEAEWFENREPGKLDEELGIGIGVLPVTSRVFRFWQPRLLFNQEVTEAERADLDLALGAARPWDDLIYA